MNFFRVNEKGISLTEVLIFLLLSVLVLGAIYNLFSGSLTIWQKGEDIADIQNEARFAMDKMVKEIRMIKTINNNETTQTVLSFTTPEETVTYQQQDSKLIRNGQIIARYVSNIRFDYFGTNLATYTGSAYNADVRLIRINLTVAKGDEERTLVGEAAIRNR